MPVRRRNTRKNTCKKGGVSPHVDAIRKRLQGGKKRTRKHGGKGSSRANTADVTSSGVVAYQSYAIKNGSARDAAMQNGADKTSKLQALSDMHKGGRRTYKKRKHLRRKKHTRKHKKKHYKKRKPRRKPRRRLRGGEGACTRSGTAKYNAIPTDSSVPTFSGAGASNDVGPIGSNSTSQNANQQLQTAKIQAMNDSCVSGGSKGGGRKEWYNQFIYNFGSDMTGGYSSDRFPFDHEYSHGSGPRND